ncbi:uncharacterized protein [Watersipora subatra]|uniref:uncharacterized protein n=1 Tax=Watersipora subatra TaxID=2589382 RepID=UPI00355AEF84
MPADLLSHATNSSEKKKKISIRGVLNKDDLAEAYNCEKKKGWRRRSSTSNLSSLDQQMRVNSVDFKEASIDDFLSPVKSDAKERSPLKPQGVTPNFYEAVRMMSQIDKTTGLPKRPSTPEGYEPEHSLRRQSVATRPSQLQRGSAGLRRLSHLDKPRISPTIVEGKVQEKSSPGEPTYASENLLRKTDSQPNMTSINKRNRRVGVLSERPIVLTSLSTPEKENLESPRAIRTSLHESSHTKLTALKIPEDEAVSNEPQAVKTGLQRRRKASQNLTRLDKMNVITETLPKIALPKRDSASSPSPDSISATSMRIKSSPSTPSLVSHTSAGLMKTKRPSTSSLPLSASSSKLTSLMTSKKSSTKNVIRHEPDYRQANSHKYWENYLLHVSHSWKNFNTDSHYGY